MKKMINELKDGEAVQSVFSVKYKHPVSEYKNGFRFVVGLSDKTGEIELNFWGPREREKVEAIFNSFSINDIVFIEGAVSSFNGKMKIDVNNVLRKALPGEYELEDFVHKTNHDIEKIAEYLLNAKDSIANAHLKSLLDTFFSDKEFFDLFKKSPAAMFIHHACVGGLAEHTYGVLKLCETELELHKSLDRDLLITGAILHDIGKTKEFEVSSNIRVSKHGMLRSHISLGEEMILERVSRLPDFPEELKQKLLHMMISHHGKHEYGAMKEPQFPEAAALFHADLFDSQITQYIRCKKDAQTEDFRTFNKNLGEIYLE